MGHGCKSPPCSLKCKEKISEDRRKEIFKTFNKMGDKAIQVRIDCKE